MCLQEIGFSSYLSVVLVLSELCALTLKKIFCTHVGAVLLYLSSGVTLQVSGAALIWKMLR